MGEGHNTESREYRRRFARCPGRTRKANRSIYERLEIIQSQLDDEERQLQKLLDLYLSGDFPKEMLLEKRNRLEELITNLKAEQAQLSNHLQTVTYSDQDIAAIVDFCAKIRENLDIATFEGKRRILELLDVRGTLAIENDERVIYVSCLISPQPVSLAPTLPLSSCHGQNTITLTTWVILERLQRKGDQISLADMLFSHTNLAQVCK